MKRIDELPNFPCQNLESLQKLLATNAGRLGVDRAFALRWSKDGPYAATSVRFWTTFLTWVPVLSMIGYIAWAISQKRWSMLWGIPLLIVGYYALHPGIGSMLGPIQTVLIGAIVIGQLYGLFAGKTSLFVLCTVLFLIWDGTRRAYAVSSKALIKASAAHEDLLCALWADNLLTVKMTNGDEYWSRFKVLNGQIIHYE